MYFKKKSINSALISKCLWNISRNDKNKTGAFLSFSGIVRNDKIKKTSVKEIHYFAYNEMAEKVFNNIENQILKKYKLQHIVILHSLGKVKAGEVSLWIGISSAHRINGIYAMKEILDRIKNEVPIWKKEVYEDGTYSWVNQ